MKQPVPPELFEMDGDPLADFIRTGIENGYVKYKRDEKGEPGYKLTRKGRKIAQRYGCKTLPELLNAITEAARLMAKSLMQMSPIDQNVTTAEVEKFLEELQASYESDTDIDIELPPPPENQ